MRKCSIEELSSRTKLSKYKIKQFEAGKIFQSLGDLYKISTALNVSLDFLFDRFEETTIVKLIQRKMPKKDRLAAIEMARYASRGPISLLKQFNMDIFEPIPCRKLDTSEACAIGKLIAQEWSDGSSLSLVLEKKRDRPCSNPLRNFSISWPFHGHRRRSSHRVKQNKKF